jgi:IS1 family transposase
MNQLCTAKRAQIISCLIEGNSVRATARLTGICKDTILKLLCDLGPACARFHDRVARNLSCTRLEVDELWCFRYSKDRNIPDELQGQRGIGSVWTWVSMDSDSKFVANWLVGNRTAEDAMRFMNDLAPRLSHRVQITSDGHKPYVEAVEDAFGSEVDFALLVKMYGNDNPNSGKKRAVCIGSQMQIVAGNPKQKFISTSLIERQNLTVRMANRRFTRKTNAFSKKIQNLEHSVALHYVYYNFVRAHQTLRVALQCRLAWRTISGRLRSLLTGCLMTSQMLKIKALLHRCYKLL